MQLHCSKCDADKYLQDFYVNKSGKRVGHCKDCTREFFRNRYRNDPVYRACHQERRRRTGRVDQLRVKYNMTDEDYGLLLDAQKGVCALCGTKSFGRKKSNHFAIDHCHVTGKVRGLLCHPCNVKIGAYEKLLNEVGIDKVSEYLLRSKE